MDWPIETSASATSAFAAGIQNPAYAGNEFGDLGAARSHRPTRRLDFHVTVELTI